MISPIFQLVVEDVINRDRDMQLKHARRMNKDTYGDKTLQEAYEEAMDLCVYLRAEIERRL